MKKVILIMLLMLFASLLLVGKKVPLPDLVKPRHIAVDENQMYVTQGATVFIYSLKDFKLIKKFGKEGEGPQEFKRRITFLDVQTEYLFLISAGKVSYFTKNGTFKKEFRTLSPEMKLKPLGKNFVAGRMVAENSTLYLAIGIYDGNLKKIKELYKQEMEVQLGGKGTKIYAHPLPFHPYGDKLFIARGKDFVIEVLDNAGNKQYDITYDYKKIKVTEADKKKVMNHLKTDPETKPYLEMLKPILFPDYFPAIRNYYAADGKVYVFTYKENNNKSEVFLFDIKGTFLKKLFVPCLYMSPVDEYPAAIKNGKFYQLVENEDSEEWELHINRIN
jgi:hypothetical protein